MTSKNRNTTSNDVKDIVSKDVPKVNSDGEKKPSTLSALASTYIAERSRDPRSDACGLALMEYASAVAYSVLKRCIDTSGDNTLRAKRREISAARHDLGALDYCNKTAFVVRINDDGDVDDVTADTYSRDELRRLAASTIGDGFDLVHDAIIAIQAEYDAQQAREAGSVPDFDKPYTVRRLSRRVYIQSADSVNGWETVETTPTREIFRAVRRAIMAQRAPHVVENGFAYLEGEAVDEQSGETARIYRRFARYADIGGDVSDAPLEMAGAPRGLTSSDSGTYTADAETVEAFDALLARLNLTTKQASILKLRISGHGHKAIARYLGISEGSVKSAVREIRRKATEAGLTPPTK